MASPLEMYSKYGLEKIDLLGQMGKIGWKMAKDQMLFQALEQGSPQKLKVFKGKNSATYETASCIATQLPLYHISKANQWYIDYWFGLWEMQPIITYRLFCVYSNCT